MPHQGFYVGLDKLASAKQAVEQTASAMDRRGVEDICGSVEQYGHQGIHDAFSEFSDLWQDGVETMLDNTEGVAENLGAVIENYGDSDAKAIEAFQAVSSELEG